MNAQGKMPAKPKRGRPADPAKRDAIIEVARRLFNEHGYGIGLDTIAKEAGVARQTIYNLFASKEDLFAAIVQQGSETITAPLLDHPADATPREVLTRFGEGYLTLIQSERAVALQRLLIASAITFPSMTSTFFANGPGRARQRLATYLNEAAGQGHLKIEDAAEAADHLVGLMLGTLAMQRMLLLATPQEPAAIKRRIGRAVDMFLRAYAP